MATKKKLDRGREVRRLARERLGTVPASRRIEPKARRKKPKHKKPLVEE
jgi:hypothetical protein